MPRFVQHVCYEKVKIGAIGREPVALLLFAETHRPGFFERCFSGTPQEAAVAFFSSPAGH